MLTGCQWGGNVNKDKALWLWNHGWKITDVGKKACMHYGSATI